MSKEREMNSALEKYAELIDIPDYLHEEAVDKYEEVAEWLGEDRSELAEHSPIAYSQGSFRLGTVTKPASEMDCYDIDFVCRLNLEKTDISKKELKRLLGSRLAENSDYKAILEEKGRCWTINFSDIFKMDVLPTIPDAEKQPNGILLTDKDLAHWQKSNPIKYAEWFRSRMAQEWDKKRIEIAKSRKIDIEKVNEWNVKTTLQRAVQILKHHRDIFFKNSANPKPASVIITTLAANAYQGQDNLRDALIFIIKDMHKFIKQESGKYIVENPAADENFAEKWNTDSKRLYAFKSWHTAVNGQLLSALESNDIKLLQAVLGGDAIKKAFSTGGIIAISNPILAVPAMADYSHRQALSWPVETSAYQVRVTCDVYTQNKSRKVRVLEDGQSVPKKRKLRLFASTNVPQPYEVKWQVVNTGTEASVKPGQLRGGFYDCDFKNGRWEDTQYKGTHWVEAMILKNGACIARSGPFYIKIRNSLI